MDKRRILLTGAAGGVGTQMRKAWAGKFALLRCSDLNPMEAAGPGEETIVANLADEHAIEKLCDGIDAIVHFGGQATEAEWPRVVAANITGLINLYEGARKGGVDRILFASSNHAVGFHRRDKVIDHTASAKPDSHYGLSKAFGEDMAQYYALKHGIRGYSMRIGSCFPKPVNARMLATWISYADMDRLCTVGLDADYVNEIVYGMSRNTRAFWDNSNAYRLGYDPQDNAETWAGDVAGIKSDVELDEALQGGQFVSPGFTGRKDWVL